MEYRPIQIPLFSHFWEIETIHIEMEPNFSLNFENFEKSTHSFTKFCILYFAWDHLYTYTKRLILLCWRHIPVESFVLSTPWGPWDCYQITFNLGNLFLNPGPSESLWNKSIKGPFTNTCKGGPDAKNFQCKKNFRAPFWTAIFFRAPFSPKENKRQLHRKIYRLNFQGLN